MIPETDTHSSFDTGENFAALLEESFPVERRFEDSVVRGRVVMIDGSSAVIDVGLKSEGRVPLREFTSPGEVCDLKPGDEVEVFVERMENKNGEAILSREKARRAEAWMVIEQKFLAEENVTGVIFGRVKGGFTVDLSGALAFLPGSQVDIRPIRDVSPLMGQPQPFRILKMDRRRGNIVVSRRSVLEESRSSDRSKLMSKLEEGQVLDGVVKNITDYGAFVDLGGADGLLHVTDMAWHRVNHPDEVLKIGETVTVKVTRFNPETQRISLGMKQLLPDPWDEVKAKYPKGTQLKGRVTNITDYGAFVELTPGVEGLVHVSEMSWTEKNIHPGKIVSTSQEVDVQILDVDSVKRRISLGTKQCMENPWRVFADTHPIGSEYEGEVKNTTEFGLFVGLPGSIDGMIHHTDLDWERSGEEAIKAYTKGSKVKVKILSVDPDKERISLGVKQLTPDPFGDFATSVKEGDDVTCEVTAVEKTLLEVKLSGDIHGIIRKSELSTDRSEQRTDRFAVGERLDARIRKIDAKERKVTLSVKARESEEERAAMARYGSSDSGAVLGDILGAALDEAKAKDKTKDSGQESELSGDSEAKAPVNKPADKKDLSADADAKAAPKKTSKAAKTAKKSTSSDKKKASEDTETAEKETAEKNPAGKTAVKKAAAKKTTAKKDTAKKDSGGKGTQAAAAKAEAKDSDQEPGQGGEKSETGDEETKE